MGAVEEEAEARNNAIGPSASEREEGHLLLLLVQTNALQI